MKDVMSSLILRRMLKSLRVVRTHWQNENSLHWILDVTFREDACQVKNANEASSSSR